MNTLQIGVIKLIDSALTGKSYNFSPDFNLEEVYELAQKHNIVPLVYYGALNCKFDQGSKAMQTMFLNTCQNMSISTQQLYQLDEAFKNFNNEGIKYMPLKGCLLKKIYPKPEMRVMGDADILIDLSQYEKISEIMKKLGYNEKYESDHELVWTKNNLIIELHKSIVPTYSKDYYSYYGDGWKFAKKCDGTRYYMTDEDQLIYLFTHFAKHYRSSGIGIKHLVDLRVYFIKNPNLDMEYIRTELEKLKLYKFFINIMDTLNVWFEEKEENDKTKLITEVIFNNGTFGLKESGALWAAIKNDNVGKSTSKIRIKKIFKTIFLPYNKMTQIFPVLIKCPFLLPILWFVRIIKLIFRKGKVQSFAKELDALSKEKIENHYDTLNFVGFDFIE